MNSTTNLRTGGDPSPRRTGLRALLAAASLALCSEAEAGKYALAFWREMGAYENQAPPSGEFGNHSAHVHIWNEDGSPRGNVPLYTSWGVFLGNTDGNGYIEIALYRPNGYDIQVRDGTHQSDTTPIFNEERAPSWGHYSWELGFLYKANAAGGVTFDTQYDGTLNATGDSPCEDLSAPGTRSLAYRSTKATDYCSDAYGLGDFVAFHGQTFVATGNRVLAVKAQPTVGFGTHLKWSAQILAGGPSGTPIGPVKTTRDMVSDEYFPILLKWGADEVPVVAGQTYFLKVWRADTAGGLNVWHVNNNNYAGGQYYSAGTAVAAQDMVGLVVCGTSGVVGPAGTISGTVTAGGNLLAGATITGAPGGLSATSNSAGLYSITGVPEGSYTLTASRTGFATQTANNVAVQGGGTTTVNFAMTTLPLQNTGFENSFTAGVGNGWSTFINSGTPQFLDETGWKRTGTHSQRWWTSYTTHDAGIYQRLAVPAGASCTFSAWTWRSDQWGNGSVNEQTWVGIDPDGGTNPQAAGIVWSAPLHSYQTWTQQQVTATARAANVTVFVRGKGNYAGSAMITLVDDAAFSTGAPPANGTPLMFVSEGATWKYLATGVSPGAQWTATAFDDSAWPSGPAQLGFGDGDEGTVVPNNGQITTWFRRAFAVTDKSAVRALGLRFVRDDGIAVYLNGKRVALDNLAAGAAPGDTADTTIADAAESAWHIVSVDPADLNEGANVLAAEVHQSSSTSTDISFDLALRAYTAADLVPPRAVASGGNVTLTWAGTLVDFEPAQSIDLVAWTPVTAAPVAAGNEMSVTFPIAGGRRYFRLQMR